MSKGKTTVIFKGGSLDGHIDDCFDTRGLIDVIRMPTGGFFAVDDNLDGIKVCQGKLSSNWIAFLVETYRKQSRSLTSEPFTYFFEKELLIDRCTAFTLNGSRCSREALFGLPYCNKTHQKWANPQLIDVPTDHSGIIKP